MRVKYEKKDFYIEMDRDCDGAVPAVRVRAEGTAEGRTRRGEDL